MDYGAAATLVVGGLAFLAVRGQIAAQDRATRVERERVKMDLFDRRFAIYSTILDCLSEATSG